MIYLMLFGSGKILFGHLGLGLGMMAAGTIALLVLFWSLNRQGWQSFR